MFNLIPKAYAQISIGSSYNIGQSPVANFSNIGYLFNPVILSVYVIASVILFIFLILGGLMFIINAGKADKEGMEKGKATVMTALIGYFIVFSSYWIIMIIEFITGIDIFYSFL